jgi:hypothetical protein
MNKQHQIKSELAILSAAALRHRCGNDLRYFVPDLSYCRQAAASAFKPAIENSGLGRAST